MKHNLLRAVALGVAGAVAAVALNGCSEELVAKEGDPSIGISDSQLEHINDVAKTIILDELGAEKTYGDRRTVTSEGNLFFISHKQRVSDTVLEDGMTFMFHDKDKGTEMVVWIDERSNSKAFDTDEHTELLYASDVPFQMTRGPKADKKFIEKILNDPDTTIEAMEEVDYSTCMKNCGSTYVKETFTFGPDNTVNAQIVGGSKTGVEEIAMGWYQGATDEDAASRVTTIIADHIRL